MGNLPDIPLEELFPEIEYPDIHKSPLRWWSVKTTMEYLGVSMRQVRRYIKAGKLQYQYKTVKGRKRVFISNQSAIELRPTLNKYKEKDIEEPEYDEEEDTPLEEMDAFLALGEMIVAGKL